MPNHVTDVLISGMGPGGLVCALEAVKQGKKVLMITNRGEDFLRPQKVILDEFTVDYLNQLKPTQSSQQDLDLLNEATQYGRASIKDIERFLKKRLDEYQPLIEYDYYQRVSEINLEEGKATIESLDSTIDKHQKEIQFNWLIGADGVSHNVTNVFNQNNGNPIQYYPIPGPDHKYHGSFYIEIITKNQNNLSLPIFLEWHLNTLQSDIYYQNQKNDIVEKKFNYYLLTDQKPCTHKKFNTKRIKASFIGEIPQHLYHAFKEPNHSTESQDNLLHYVKTCVAQMLCIDPENLIVKITPHSRTHGEAKDRLKLQFFEMNLHQADCCFIEKGENHLELIGDAYQSPNYTKAEGLNNAFIQAKMLGEKFKQQKKEINQIKTIDKLCENYLDNLKAQITGELIKHPEAMNTLTHTLHYTHHTTIETTYHTLIHMPNSTRTNQFGNKTTLHQLNDIIDEYQSISDMQKIVNEKGIKNDEFKNKYRHVCSLIQKRGDSCGIIFLKTLATICSLGIATCFGLWKNTKSEEKANDFIKNINNNLCKN